MKKHTLSTTGLSLSQAQSISNLCHQAARDIDAKLSVINNASKSLTIDRKDYIETQGNPIPENIVDMLTAKSQLHATQAFLMENIKAKQQMLDDLKSQQFVYDVEAPEYPDLQDVKQTPEVTEEWGWQQLTATEYSEYLEAEAYASHFGQFIHKGGKLDKLRTELPTMKTLEWLEVEKDKKTPLTVTIHHTIDQLGEIHDDLAGIHRAYEQKVNYFKAKVKNLVTLENARIARENADSFTTINQYNDNLLEDYRLANTKWRADFKVAEQQFEENRQTQIKETAALRIGIDPRYQSVIDSYLMRVQE